MFLHKISSGVQYWITHFLIIFFTFLAQANSQRFVYDCNDPLIDPQHMQIYGHTYCDHACRPNIPMPVQACSASGTCLCSVPCYNGAPPPPLQPIANDFCPPAGNVPDPDPNTQANCDAACPRECTGGTGATICGENPFPGMEEIRICTCICPPQPCVTTTTTTTPAPVVVVVPAPLLIPIKLKKVLLWVKKAFLLCWLLLKVYVLKVLLISYWKWIISYHFNVDLDISFQEVQALIRWILWYFD